MVYYAHSKLEYGTFKEEAERLLLCRHFGAVYDPNNRMLEDRSMGDGSRAMDLCLELVRGPHVTALAFSTPKDGWVGRGVYREVEAAKESGKPVLMVEWPLGIRTTSSSFLRPSLRDLGSVVLDVVDESDWVHYARLGEGSTRPPVAVRVAALNEAVRRVDRA